MVYLSERNPHSRSITETLPNRYTEKPQVLSIHMLYLGGKKKKKALV